MSKAKVGDLIRVSTGHLKGGIFEVNEINVFGTVFTGDYAILEDNYVIHRKCGEEDEETTSVKDAINPQHYKQGRVEVIDIIEDAVQGADPFEAVLQANIIKYTQRYRNKNGVEDLKKAQWYLDKLVAHLENK